MGGARPALIAGQHPMLPPTRSPGAQRERADWRCGALAGRRCQFAVKRVVHKLGCSRCGLHDKAFLALASRAGVLPR